MPFMNPERSDRLVDDDDFASVGFWLERTTHRYEAQGLIFDLELATGSVHKRAGRAILTGAEVQELLALLEVTRRRGERLLPRHCGAEVVHSGFEAARGLITSWATPPADRAVVFPCPQQFADLATLHASLRALRQAFPVIKRPERSPPAPPPPECQVIPFPQPPHANGGMV